jgi:hypothetical protein
MLVLADEDVKEGWQSRQSMSPEDALLVERRKQGENKKVLKRSNVFSKRGNWNKATMNSVRTHLGFTQTRKYVHCRDGTIRTPSSVAVGCVLLLQCALPPPAVQSHSVGYETQSPDVKHQYQFVNKRNARSTRHENNRVCALLNNRNRAQNTTATRITADMCQQTSPLVEWCIPYIDVFKSNSLHRVQQIRPTREILQGHNVVRFHQLLDEGWADA